MLPALNVLIALSVLPALNVLAVLSILSALRVLRCLSALWVLRSGLAALLIGVAPWGGALLRAGGRGGRGGTAVRCSAAHRSGRRAGAALSFWALASLGAVAAEDQVQLRTDGEDAVHGLSQHLVTPTVQQRLPRTVLGEADGEQAAVEPGDGRVVLDQHPHEARGVLKRGEDVRPGTAHHLHGVGALAAGTGRGGVPGGLPGGILRRGRGRGPGLSLLWARRGGGLLGGCVPLRGGRRQVRSRRRR